MSKRYLMETYTDEYHTLVQNILIDLELDKESNGLHAAELRRSINPNLTYLLKSEYIERKEDVYNGN